MNQSDTTLEQKIDEIFGTMNGSGAHACYCDRSVDNGCKCAIKDEYAAEAKAAIISLIEQEKQKAATAARINELEYVDGNAVVVIASGGIVSEMTVADRIKQLKEEL